MNGGIAAEPGARGDGAQKNVSQRERAGNLDGIQHTAMLTGHGCIRFLGHQGFLSPSSGF